MPRLNTRRQSGVVLLLFLFLAIVASASILVDRLDSVASVRLNYDRKTDLALAAGKEALLGWAISNPNLLGSLPWPDRGDDTDGYDGFSDCANQPFRFRFLIGRFPSLGRDPAGGTCQLNIPGLDAELRDGSGEPLWYAVSRNLVRDYNAGANPVINSNWDLAPYPWLTVWDQNTGASVPGADGVTPARVAFVIIAPGPAVGVQNRSAVAPAVGNYLDSITIGATTFNNADGDGCPDGTGGCPLDSSAEDFAQGAISPTFNDRLVYVTIDEMVRYLERRVLQEVRDCLDAYAAISNGKYPWPSGVTPVDYTTDPGVRFGRIPTDVLNTTDLTMSAGWPGTCFTWTHWTNWQESIFYAVDSQFAPGGPAVPPIAALSLDGAAVPAVVLSAGSYIPGIGQLPRAGPDQGFINNYLENENVDFPGVPSSVPPPPPADEAFVTNATVGPLNLFLFNDTACAATLAPGAPTPCRR